MQRKSYFFKIFLWSRRKQFRQPYQNLCKQSPIFFCSKSKKTCNSIFLSKNFTNWSSGHIGGSLVNHSVNFSPEIRKTFAECPKLAFAKHYKKIKLQQVQNWDFSNKTLLSFWKASSTNSEGGKSRAGGQVPRSWNIQKDKLSSIY